MTSVKQAMADKSIVFDRPAPGPGYGYNAQHGGNLCPTCPVCRQRAAHCVGCRGATRSTKSSNGSSSPGTTSTSRATLSFPSKIRSDSPLAEQAALFGIDLDRLEKDKKERYTYDLHGPDDAVNRRAGLAAQIAETEWHAGGYGTETFDKVGGKEGDKSNAAAVKACVLGQLFEAEQAMIKVEPKLKEVIANALDEHTTEVVKVSAAVAQRTDLKAEAPPHRPSSMISRPPSTGLIIKLPTTSILLKMNRLLIDHRKREDKLNMDIRRLEAQYLMDGPNAVIKNAKQVYESRWLHWKQRTRSRSRSRGGRMSGWRRGISRWKRSLRLSRRESLARAHRDQRLIAPPVEQAVRRWLSDSRQAKDHERRNQEAPHRASSARRDAARAHAQVPRRAEGGTGQSRRRGQEGVR